MDNVLNKQELLRQIQELGFVALELNLFLDTHPDDEAALNDFCYITNNLNQLKQLYCQNFGPLINFGNSMLSKNTWTWASEDDKWPWENK